MEQEDPSLAMDLMDIELPKWEASRTVKFDPHLNIPNTDKVLPHRTKLLNDILEPIKIVSKSDT